MNNEKMVKVNGQCVPVGRMRHWKFSPETFNPMGSPEERRQWSIFMGVKDAWERLDPEIFRHVLSSRFEYGSYWVASQTLNREGYQEYIGPKFDTIRRKNSRPTVKVAVLYEGLAPEQFNYALVMRQGDVETLLTFKFDDEGLAALYMTEPQIFTFEPTFAKGGILGNGGGPRDFKHECAEEEEGKPMSAASFRSFAADCVALMFREAGAEIVGGFGEPGREFPVIITKCGVDTFYHRIDVSTPDEDGKLHYEGLEEFVAIARSHGAWPMAMPVSLWCSNAKDGAEPRQGGVFFMKCGESRSVG